MRERVVFIVGCAGIALASCKPRTDTTAGLQSTGATGNEIHCRFEIPDGRGQGFEMWATPQAGFLSNVRGRTFAREGGGEEQSKASAPVADRAKLISIGQKPLEQQGREDRSIRAWQKDLFNIDQDKYSCFDISGVGPGKESYFCMDKSMQVASSQALWISDYRYENDLNVLNINGANCN